MEKSSFLGKNILTKLGFTFPNGSSEEIPTTEQKSADYLAVYGEDTFLIEVKLKEPDEKESAKRSESLNNGEVYSCIYEIKTALDNIIRKANQQLRESSRNFECRFRVVLLIIDTYAGDLYEKQLIDLLYGRVSLIKLETQQEISCYGYERANFQRRSDIDMVVVSDVSGNYYKGYINIYSGKYNDLKESSFFISLKSKYYDPHDYITNNQALVLNNEDWDIIGEISSHDKKVEEIMPCYSKKLQRIEDKYGFKCCVFKPKPIQHTIQTAF
ncbi:hypothetical protein [Frederiksenia canicola]|uniref:Uncharacterized protein n=1 Tax=Frederiksenia canicola TaxID=123824 RepID=A0AAE6X738_9PAST|nr:hypothetical protein [Frederiksenia canicola]QIM65109.1 hypothetical protein A4G17_06510 [Frederiksenia canicola]RPE96471.1 hypothetical protein EDC49_0864 [Frederiksenia canicola]